MNTIAPDTTLADLVNADPSLARELERRGLDYCCGGHRTLAQACAERDLEVELVAFDLAAASAPPLPAPWTAMSAVELVEHIVATHHRYLWDELPRLTALMEKVASVHGTRHPELDGVATGLADLRADLEPHLLKEERVLFPMIGELAVATTPPAFHCGSVRNPIAVMMREHDHAGELLARLRRLTDGYEPPADGCVSYAALFRGLEQLEADTHLHVHKENNLLFPLVVQLEARFG